MKKALIILLFIITASISSFSKYSKKPDVKLFVMSHCPFGIQMIKAILPVWRLLDKKINFKIHFCDYVMHGKKEILEQTKQHCIQSTNQKLFRRYLGCFSIDGSSKTCNKLLKNYKKKIYTCQKTTERKYNLIKNYKNIKTWKDGYPVFNIDASLSRLYKVKGSPTLIINEKVIQPNRTPKVLLKAICSGFTIKPKECSATLSDKTPIPGFGEGYDTGNSKSNCGD